MDISKMGNTIQGAIYEVGDEVYRTTITNEPFNSAHEGYAVLLEEVDELWDEVKVRRSQRDLNKMRKEACQVAAMAIRFMIDVCETE